jgi:hypothetical protein
MMQQTTISARPAAAAATEATLFLPQGMRGELCGLLAGVEAALTTDAAGFRRIAARPDEFTVMERDGRRVVVALCPEPVAVADLAGRAADRATVARLRDHCACVSVSVQPRAERSAARGVPTDAAADDRLCAEVVARVLPVVGADLVHWTGSGQLQRAEDLNGNARVPVRRPTTRTPRPVLSALNAATARGDQTPHPVSRIGRAPVAVPRPRRPAELRATLADARPAAAATPPDLIRARARAQAEAVFPPLAPADGDGSHEDLTRTRFAIYGDGGPQFGDRDAPAVQRLSVYALNMSLIVAAAPVGAAVLAVNMIFGENMRLTSHALALTGISVGTDLPERALALLSQLL